MIFRRRCIRIKLYLNYLLLVHKSYNIYRYSCKCKLSFPPEQLDESQETAKQAKEEARVLKGIYS